MTPTRHEADPLAAQAARFDELANQRPESPQTVRRVYVGEPEPEGPHGAKSVDLGRMRRALEEDGELPQ